MQQPPHVSPDSLRDFGTAVYTRLGMQDAEARLVADTLVQADLWGHQSHGVMRLPWYAARLQAGSCNPVAVPELLVDAGAIALLDGKDGMGQVVAARAAEEAIKRAKAHGIGAVGVRNSGHFGTAMYYTLMAAREGCVAFLSTNASPAMAPWGGRKKIIGNNPWSWAAPAGSHAPMVLDIANTGVARGKVYLAKQKGLPIPEGWAITAEGEPTTDAAAAIDGIILPMAQHKGYAIAVIMDMLSGVLTGSAFTTGVSGPYQAEKRSGAGHMMIVLNIAAMQPLAEFGTRMDAYVATLKAAPLAKGYDEVFYPGEIEARNDQRNRETGLSLPDDTIHDLQQLASSLSLTAPF